MKKLLVVLLATIIFSNCKKHTQPLRMALIGVPTAFVLTTRYISHSDSTLSVEMKIGVFTSRDREVTNLNDSAFHAWPASTFGITINNIEQQQASTTNSFSTILAFDQSASYSEYDPLNQRLRAVNKVLLDMESQPKNEFGLAYFNRSDRFENDLEIRTRDGGNPFNISRESLLKWQFWMPDYEKGTANMYDAISLLIDTVSTYASNNNTSITIFMHAIDDRLGATYKTITSKAIAKGVKINIISLDPIHKELAEICSRTGGFLHLIDRRTIGEVMDKGVPAITSIIKAVSGNLNVYTIHFTVKRSSGIFSSGYSVNDYLLLQEHDADGQERIYNPLGFYVKIP